VSGWPRQSKHNPHFTLGLELVGQERVFQGLLGSRKYSVMSLALKGRAWIAGASFKDYAVRSAVWQCQEGPIEPFF